MTMMMNIFQVWLGDIDLKELQKCPIHLCIELILIPVKGIGRDYIVIKSVVFLRKHVHLFIIYRLTTPYEVCIFISRIKNDKKCLNDEMRKEKSQLAVEEWNASLTP